MSISAIGTSALTTLSQTTAKNLLKDMDADQSGSVSKEEFVAFGEKMKANGAMPPANGASSPKMPSADELFSKADGNTDQSLSVDELAAMMAQAEAQHRGSTQQTSAGMKEPAEGGKGAPPPSGAGGPPPGGGMRSANGNAESTEDSSTNTDPADTNGDGTVSAAEKLIYELTHGTSETTGSEAG